ncbi:MAG: transglutaminase-like domain-containing protein [Bacteroidales bacterium]
MKISIYLSIISVVLILFGCEKNNNGPVSSFFLFPAGRSFTGQSEIKVIINNDTVTNPDFICDSCGGYWIKIQKSVLPAGGQIIIIYTRRKGELVLFKEPGNIGQKWLSESQFIDCNNEALKARANELTNDYLNNIDKAKQIQSFIENSMTFDPDHRDSFLEKASLTYDLKIGTCMNFSRLFVALCRAANIPARTIWGVVYDHDGGNIYDYHHQWAEVLDNTGYWHPVDFTYTKSFNLNDIRYLDLIYSAEENTTIENRLSEEIILGNVKYFDNYPATVTGRLGFELVENKLPESMTIKYVFKF